MADIYEIVDIVTRRDPTSAGMRKYRRITFTTKPSGLVDDVDMEPGAPLTAEAIDELVRPVAAELERARKL